MLLGVRGTNISMSSKMMDNLGFVTRKTDIHLYAPLCRVSSKRLIQILQLRPKMLNKGEPISTHSNQKLLPAIALSIPTPSNEKPTSTKWKSQKSKSKTQSTDPKCEPSPKSMRENVKGLVFMRYVDYVKSYEKVLEKNFPAAIKLYRIFFEGVRNFYHDLKWYMKVLRIVRSSPDGLRALNIKELELYMKMPKDMVKVAPALIGTSLPIIGYAFFPLIFMYPRQFLTSHFWTLQQRDEFQIQELQERFMHSNPIIRRLQRKLKSVKEPIKHNELSQVLRTVKCGFFPTKRELILVKEQFANPPFSLQSLSKRHIDLLSGMHGLPGNFSKRVKLKEHAFLIQYMDWAIRREGDVHNMPHEVLERACVIRGLNPANMREYDIIAWLKNWIEISTSIQEQHMSLLLHLPIFLGFNHPNNFQLCTRPKEGSRTKFHCLSNS